MSLPAVLPRPPATRRVAVLTAGDWALLRRDGVVVDDQSDELVLEVVPDDGVVEWPTTDGVRQRAGLTHDRHGRLYRGAPERGQIQCLLPGSRSPVDLLDGPAPHPPDDPDHPPAVGFVGVGGGPERPLEAVALATDDDEHLVVLDAATGTLAVLDLLDGHLLRAVALDGVPVDVAADGTGAVLVAMPSRERPLERVDALGMPVHVEVEAGRLAGVPRGAVPSRVAVGPDGTVWLLLSAVPVAGSGSAAGNASVWVVAATGPSVTALEVPGGRDLAVDGDGLVVVAGPPGGDLRTWRRVGGGLHAGVPLLARGYDGRGIARTPDGRIVYWNGVSRRTALPRRVRRVRTGTVVTRALDGLAPRCRWGRVFVEACVPPDTRLLVAATTTEVDPAEAGAVEPGEAGVDGRAPALRPLHRRETGRELAWSPLEATDRYEVYEAPVEAPPGRFLTLRFGLAGPGGVTPRVRAVRVELSGTDLLDRLPRTYARDPEAASFLRRFLLLLEGPLAELEARAVRRDLLLDPWSAPPEMLDWIGSLVGLSLDARWPDRVRRRMLAESAALYRTRGTVGGLQRMLEIYLECRVVVLEAFRMRARPASVGGSRGDGDRVEARAGAVVGTGLRVGGGSVGAAHGTADGPEPAGTTTPSDKAAASGDAYRAQAHRFTVLVGAELDDGRRAVLDDLLELYRPAHTLVEVCTIGDGMRVGVGLHAGLSSVVGPGSGLRPLTVGGPVALGRDGMLGRGRAGVRPGATRAGAGTAVDA